MRKGWLMAGPCLLAVAAWSIAMPRPLAADSGRTASPAASASITIASAVIPRSPAPPSSASLLNRYAKAKPKLWGDHIPGVMTRLDTKDKVIALTFDACGGPKGNGYDNKLIDYLMEQNIPATLFVNARWIDANPAIFSKLASNPLFEIENHGTEHRPLSVTGRSIYNIRGTKNAAAVITEVNGNEEKIAGLTGRRPLFFRAGTAYYDDVAVAIVHDLGLQPVNYSVLGDAGATYNTNQVYKALLGAKPGSIVIGHMNHPEKDTAEGVMRAVPELRKEGYRFVQLADYKLKGSK
ncbi:hypothetical protein AXX17_ATUG04130 [Arabidopsis thaliana]|uniref:NodB homology domain-containing protein n=1 Tax=Arabidopsis thaliana TaxID=3702 RepID=A0A178U7P7_ARATH|nr:hypothetical protein AXX17_ATUG04130 [Arabidopsis thaliana]